jgi:hypothetical protein
MASHPADHAPLPRSTDGAALPREPLHIQVARAAAAHNRRMLTDMTFVFAAPPQGRDMVYDIAAAVFSKLSADSRDQLERDASMLLCVPLKWDGQESCALFVRTPSDKPRPNWRCLVLHVISARSADVLNSVLAGEVPSCGSCGGRSACAIIRACNVCGRILCLVCLAAHAAQGSAPCGGAQAPPPLPRV